MADNRLEGKIAITGTGRCGTTFLMRMFTAYDRRMTGFAGHRDTIQRDAQAGMEHIVTASSDRWAFLRLGRVWKDPGLTVRLRGLVLSGHKPALLIVPVRDVPTAAASRFRVNRPWFPGQPIDLSKVPRDEWPSWATEAHQAEVGYAGLGRLLEIAVLHQIPITFIPWADLGHFSALWCHLITRPAMGDDEDAPARLLNLDRDRLRKAHAQTWGRLVE